MKKKFRVMIKLLRETGADRIILSYMIFVFIAAFIILISEPGITRYEEALWYCYDVLSTTGFGDVVVHGIIAKLCSVVVTVYSLVVIAIVTGIIVNFYMLIIKDRQKDTLENFMDKLERLPELSAEELTELSERIKEFRKR
ncbi:MAG: potassium channel family protein [Lachnospiraceae bacterium]|nr:potassium channel family protein [Lachnospiraceae bacterium]